MLCTDGYVLIVLALVMELASIYAGGGGELYTVVVPRLEFVWRHIRVAWNTALYTQPSMDGHGV